MARIAGIDIPREKRLEISLTYIFGIGRTTAQQVCTEVEVDPNTRVRDLTDSMYNPRKAPYVSHDRGTGLVIEHIETHWCPSTLSADLTGDPPAPRVLVMTGEHESDSKNLAG